MIKIRKLDKNGDWVFGHGKSDYIIQNSGVSLNIVTRCKEWYQDCFFALQNGIDYPTRLGNFNQKELLDRDYKNIINQSQDVVELVSFDSSFDRNTRSYKFQALILSIYSNEPFPLNFSTEGII